jgi:hypothetical protein
MKFTELRQEIKSNLNEVNSLQDYMTVYLTTSVQDKIKALNDRFVEHLFSDLIEKSTTANMRDYLGNGSYNSANEYAKSCIHTVYRSKDIFGYKLNGWTDSALKCFDNFILVLIQEKLNETINPRSDKGVERQKYWHLINKGGEYYDIGMGLDVVYQLRNEFTHVEVINDETGKRHQRSLSQKNIRKMKEVILESFKKALSELENKIME